VTTIVDSHVTTLIAVAISMAGILVYLAWRFDLRFGVAAAIAAFHDVLTVLGIFYLLNKEVTHPIPNCFSMYKDQPCESRKRARGRKIFLLMD
jgi:hypothetical protein